MCGKLPFRLYDYHKFFDLRISIRAMAARRPRAPSQQWQRQPQMTDDDSSTNSDSEDKEPAPPAAAPHLLGLPYWAQNLEPTEWLAAAISLAIIALLIFGITTESVNAEHKSNLKRARLLEEYVNALSSKFPSQSEDTKSTLHYGMRYMFDDSARNEGQPSFIVLVPSSLAHSSFPSCFVKTYGMILNRANKFGSPLPAKILNSTTFEEQDQYSIDLDIKNYFSIGGKAIIVSDIQSFKNRNDLVFFHAYCDNSHFPKKRALYFFLVSVPDVFAQKESYEDVDDLAHKIIWNDLKKIQVPEKIDPLFSRISSFGSILLNEGDVCSLSYADINSDQSPN